MRGTDPRAYLHVTELGEPDFSAWPFTPRARRTCIGSPSGRRVERRIDRRAGRRQARAPDRSAWLQIEVVHGLASRPRRSRRHASIAEREKYRRAGELMRLPPGRAGEAHGPWRHRDARSRQNARAGFARISASSAPTMCGRASRASRLLFNRCDRGEDLCRSPCLLLTCGRRGGSTISLTRSRISTT